jgi:DNA polymerase-3 subunit epsilon
VADVSYEETGSELLAMLREADEIRNHKPTFNRAHKGANFRFGIFQHYSPEGYLQFQLEELTPENEVHSVAQYFTFRQGERMLETAVKRYSLCNYHAGLDTDGQAGQPCSRKRKGQCLGACVSREAPDTYNSRAQAADALLQLEAESFFLIDKGRHWEERTVFQVEKGRLIGVGYITAEESFYKPKDLAKAIRPIAEKPETRKLIGGFIRKKKMEKLIPY